VYRSGSELNAWSRLSSLGELLYTRNHFSDANNMIPDWVWVSRDRLTVLLDSAGHLTGAPELVVEVLSLAQIMNDAIAKPNSNYIRPEACKNIGLSTGNCSRLKRFAVNELC